MNTVKAIPDDNNSYLANFISRGGRSEIQVFRLNKEGKSLSLSGPHMRQELLADEKITGSCWISRIDESNSNNGKKRARKNKLEESAASSRAENAPTKNLVIGLENGVFLILDPSMGGQTDRFSSRDSITSISPSLSQDCVWGIDSSGSLISVSLKLRKETKALALDDDQKLSILKVIDHESKSARSQHIAVGSNRLYLIDPSKPKRYLLARFLDDETMNQITIIEQSKLNEDLLIITRLEDSHIYLYDISKTQRVSTLQCSSDKIISLLLVADSKNNQEFIMAATEDKVDIFRINHSSAAQDTNARCAIITNFHGTSHNIYFKELIYDPDFGLYGIWHEGNEPKLTYIDWNYTSTGDINATIDYTEKKLNQIENGLDEIEVPETAEIKNLKVNKLFESLLSVLKDGTVEARKVVALCSSNDNESNIKESLKHFSVQESEVTSITDLFSILCSFLIASPSKYPSLYVWLKWILLIHGASISSIPEQYDNLKQLQSLFLEGIDLMPRLLSIQGRLQLLRSQSEIRDRLGNIGIENTGDEEEEVLENAVSFEQHQEEESLVIADGESDDLEFEVSDEEINDDIIEED